MTTHAFRDDASLTPDSDDATTLTWQQVQRMNCERKERFKRWDMAAKAARNVMRRNTLTKTYATPFFCRVCNGLHVGTRPARKRRIKNLWR
jgi:hypothetical protein